MFDINNAKKVKLYDTVDGKNIKVGDASYSEFDVKKELAKSTHEFEKLPFIVQDLIGLIERNNLSVQYITCIITFRIYKKYRNRGIGSSQFMKFISGMNSEHVICIKSAPLTADYPKEPDTITHINELIKQAYFLEAHGFRDINSLCQFESGMAYIYMSESAKPIIRNIISTEIRGEDKNEES